MKIRPAGTELFNAERYEEINSRFSQFCERAKKAKCRNPFMELDVHVGLECLAWNA
jgi:hypothetical protein